MTKQVAVWNLGVLLLGCLFMDAGALPLRARLSRLGLVTGGAAIAMSLILLPFIASGALDEFAYANFKYNYLYSSELPLDERLRKLSVSLRFFTIVAAPLVLASATATVFIVARFRHTFLLLLLPWLLACFLGVSSSGRFFPHYYGQALPVLSLLTTFSLLHILSQGKLIRCSLGATLALGLGVCLIVNGAVYLQPDPASRHVAKFTEPQSEWESDSLDLAAYIRAETAPGDTIFNLGRETQLYFYADRRPASRFLYDRPFWLDPPALDEAIAELKQARPALIIDSLQPPMFARPSFHPPAIRELLAGDYEFVGRVAFANVYRLKVASTIGAQEPR
jgi:hypothetical protein